MTARGTLVTLAIALGVVLIEPGVEGDSAYAHSACSVSGSNPVVHTGDEHANDCTGGSGSDDMSGLGAGDSLRGGQGRDKIRGATGNDLLEDKAQGNDQDDICDGSGSDGMDVADGDTRDKAWSLNDSPGDVSFVDSVGEIGSYSGNNCPV